MGVWIEILARLSNSGQYMSLPLWECGLKYIKAKLGLKGFIVTPLVGVWIEMM